jgi:hypothetical protein
LRPCPYPEPSTRFASDSVETDRVHPAAEAEFAEAAAFHGAQSPGPGGDFVAEAERVADDLSI